MDRMLRLQKVKLDEPGLIYMSPKRREKSREKERKCAESVRLQTEGMEDND